MPTIEQKKLSGKWNDERGQAFEKMILPHRASLHRTALGLTQNPAEAEDLVQKTMVRAFMRWHTFRNENERMSDDGIPARAWLQAILRNLFCSDLRDQKLKRRGNVSLESASEQIISLREEITPERATIAQEEFRAIRQAMHRLPKAYSEILALIIEEGLRYDEIAARLNLPVGTVRSRLHRARKRIQRATYPWHIMRA